MDEMMLAMAKEFFASLDGDGKKELFHELFDALETEEKIELLEIVLEEFGSDENTIIKVKSLICKGEKC